MRQHLKIHLRVDCKICGESVTKGKIRAHFNKIHVERKLFTCASCGYSSSIRYNYLQHISNKPRECTSCKVMIQCKILWDKHQEEEHKDGFSCDHCSFIGKTMTLIRRHRKYHTKSARCESCDERFGTVSVLKEHQIKRKHGRFAMTDVSFPCKKCEKSLGTPRSLCFHMSYHHQDENLQCDFCGKTFKGRAKIANHLRIHMKKACQSCGKKLRYLSTSRHQETCC